MLLEDWLTVIVKLGDLTIENVEVITNAANEYLSHAGGLAMAIAKAGGS